MDYEGEESFVHIIFMVELSSALMAICCGGFIFTQVSSGCVGFRFLGITLILIGIALVIIVYIMRDSVSRDVYKYQGLKFLCCSMPLLLALLALGVFALAVSSQGGGESIPGKSYKVYYLESYSKWMQNKVDHNWDKYYKKVVVDNKEIVCSEFPAYFGVDPALKFGCCQPPEECNFNYTNPDANLVRPNEKTNDECSRWDNDQHTLCFNCQSCKAGFLQDVTSKWFLIGVILVVLVGLNLLLGIPFGYSKFRIIREEVAAYRRSWRFMA